MASVTSVNSGYADLFQALSNTGSASVSSPLSSAGLQADLQSASPSDVVQISREALELQQSSSLFGTSGASQTATDPAALLLQAVSSSVRGTTEPTASASSSTGASSSAEAPAAALASALFGTNSNAG